MLELSKFSKPHETFEKLIYGAVCQDDDGMSTLDVCRRLISFDFSHFLSMPTHMMLCVESFKDIREVRLCILLILIKTRSWWKVEFLVNTANVLNFILLIKNKCEVRR
jgi:hypothetical protein